MGESEILLFQVVQVQVLIYQVLVLIFFYNCIKENHAKENCDIAAKTKLKAGRMLNYNKICKILQNLIKFIKVKFTC